MKQILFITGSDDKGRSKIVQHHDNMTINVVGAMPLEPERLQSNSISSQSKLFVLGVHKTLRLNGNADDIKVVNLVGDADGSTKSLNAVMKITRDLQFKDVINKPCDVFKTSRSALPNLLRHIDKVRIAASIAVRIKDIADLLDFVSRSKISYPIILRLAGFHNSQYMKKISCDSQLEQAKDWFNLSHDFLIVEYIEDLEVKGFYRKARIAVIDGKFYPQHFLSSEHWCVGVKDRYSTMLENPMLRKDEQLFLESFEKTILPKFKTVLNEVHSKIGLDIYGIDCFLRDNGEIVIFEANPCMDLISMWLGPNNEYIYKTHYRAAVRDAIVKLLSS